MSDQSRLVFLSHAAVDEEIAAALKRLLETYLEPAEVFVSSDPEDLTLGDPWVATVLEALQRAALVLALTTERGLARKWVWFESGRAWHTGIRCIPCCLGRVRKVGLPPPFSLLQAVNIDEESDLRLLFDVCRKDLGATCKPMDTSQATREFIRLDVRAEEKQLTFEDSFSVELRSEVSSVMQSLDPGSREALRLVLKYGEMTEGVARSKVQAARLMTDRTLLLIGLETRTGWLVKTQSSPNPRVSRDEDRYEIVPRMKVYLEQYFEKAK